MTGVYYLIQLLRSELVNKVVLLIEFDFEGLDINHKIFQGYLDSGKLEIINIKVGVWGHGFDYHKKCREAISKLPKLNYDVLFMPDDVYIMNNYLLRNTKYKCLICYQTGSAFSSLKAHRRHAIQELLKDRKLSRLNSYLQVVLWFRRILKGHVLNYFVFPFLSLGRLFYNSKSLFLMNGDAGKFADYYIVFSHKDRDYCLEDKVDMDKIIINMHPLEAIPQLYQEVHNNYFKITKAKYDIAYFLSEPHPGEFYDKFILHILKNNLELAVKLHPTTFSNKRLIEYFNELKDKYKNLIVLYDYNFYKLAAEAKIIFGETSSGLETFSYIYKAKPIVSINIERKFIKEKYKNHPIVIYIDDIKDLIDLINKIKASNKIILQKHTLRNINQKHEAIDSLLQRIIEDTDKKGGKLI